MKQLDYKNDYIYWDTYIDKLFDEAIDELEEMIENMVMHPECMDDNILEEIVEIGREEYRQAWEEYISDF